MFEKFRDRSHELERLDTGDYTPAEYARWQREMRLIHGFLGERRALYRALRSDIDSNAPIRILDIGAGSGQLLVSARSWFKTKETFLAGVELDPQAARSMHAAGIRAVIADSADLPFEDDSFDHVICSLFLHHFTDANVIRLLTEMGRVAKRSVIAIDLHRHLAAYYLYSALGRIALQEFSRHDGLLSILRGFDPAELRQLGLSSGLENVQVRRSAMFRLVLTGN